MQPGDNEADTGAAGVLHVGGSVEAPAVLDEAGLAGLEGGVADVGTRVSGRSGAAATLDAILASVRPLPDATHVTVESDDGDLAASVPLDRAGAALIVYAIGGRPLTREEGGPFRLFHPDAAACGKDVVDTCFNVKHLSSITVTAGPGRDTRHSA